MKKTILVITLLLAFSITHATIRQIASGLTVASLNNFFSPQTLMANVGDTIQWTLVSGTHTTESTTIPAGAAPWNSGNITPATFTYVVTQVGTYNYDCHHFATGGAGHGMSGTIIVSPAISTEIVINNNSNILSYYPNPFSDKITIESPIAENISFYNISGQKIKSVDVKKGETKIDINVVDFSTGVYFVKVYDGKNITTKEIIKQ